MKFFGVHIADLESDNFALASNDQIATWLFLHALCSKQRNSGVVRDARGLGERFWGRHGISAEIIESDSPLWRWQGSDLVLTPYDIEGERIAEKKSEGGRAGAKARWDRSANGSGNGTPTRSGNGSANGTPNDSPNERPNGTPKGNAIETPNRSVDAPNPTVPNPTVPASLAPDGASSDPPPTKAKDIAWNPSDGFTGITDADTAAWGEAFPALDIGSQIARANQWLLANPTKRKKAVRRFLVAWLTRSQERGGDRSHVASPHAPPNHHLGYRTSSRVNAADLPPATMDDINDDDIPAWDAQKPASGVKPCSPGRRGRNNPYGESTDISGL